MICYNHERNEFYCAVCGKGMILPKEATRYSFGLAEEDMRQLHKDCKYISPDKPYPDPEPIKKRAIFVSGVITVIAIFLLVLVAVFCLMVEILCKQRSRRPQERKHQQQEQKQQQTLPQPQSSDKTEADGADRPCILPKSATDCPRTGDLQEKREDSFYPAGRYQMRCYPSGNLLCCFWVKNNMGFSGGFFK